MKLNEQVMICQDGKLCRSNIGTVIARTKYKVMIQFMNEGTEISAWFRPYGSTKQFRENRRYGAWCDTDSLCPWYSAVTLKRVRRNLGTDADYYIDLAIRQSLDHQTKEGWND